MIMLHGLEPKEVSLVKRGANRKKFLIFKADDRQDGMPTTTNRAGDSMTVKDLIAAVGSMDPTTRKKVDAAICRIAKAEDPAAGDSNLSNEAQSALKAVAKILAPFANEITDVHIDALQEALGMAPADAEDVEALEDEELGDGPPQLTEMSADGDDDDGEEEDTEKSDKGDGMDDETKEGSVELTADAPEGVSAEDHAAAMEAAQKAYAEHMNTTKNAEPSEAEKADEPAEEDKDMATGVGKSARDKVAAILKSNELLAKSNAELIRKSARLAAELKVERDIRLDKEFIAKAEGYRFIPGDKSELAKVLKGFHERGDKEGLAQFEGVLKATDAQLGAASRMGGSIFEEMGSSQGNPNVADPQAALDAMVDGMVAKSGGKTREQLYVDAMMSEEGSKLYAQQKAIQERKGGR